MKDPKILALDIETTGLEYKDRILTIAVSHRGPDGIESKSFVIGCTDLFYTPDSPIFVQNFLSELVSQSDIIALHNASFDLAYLFGQDFLTPKQVKGKILDTLLTARMTAPRENGFSLNALCNDYGIQDERWSGFKTKRKNLVKLDVGSILAYNEMDTTYTLILAEYLWKEAVALYTPEFILRESDFSRLMAEVRVRGQKIDVEAVQKLRRKLKDEENDINFDLLGPKRIHGPNDRTGIIRYLKLKGFTGFNLTKKGNITLTEDEISKLAVLIKEREMREILKGVIRARKIGKILNTYLDPIITEHKDGDGYIHPSYSVGGTTTYRLSSSHPNGQNFPREYSDTIWEPFLSADYSQAELRLAAAYAKEQRLARIFHDGRDVHMETSISLFGQEKAAEKRKTAKNINFASLYAAGIKTIHERYHVPMDEAEEVVKDHRRLYPRLYSMTRKTADVWLKRGYIFLLSDKRLWANSKDKEREYKAFNNLIQGGVGELVKEAMLQLDERGVIITGQVHDEIRFPLDQDREVIRDVMENVLPEKITNRTNPPIKMEVDINVKGEKSADEK